MVKVCKFQYEACSYSPARQSMRAQLEDFLRCTPTTVFRESMYAAMHCSQTLDFIAKHRKVVELEKGNCLLQ